MSSVTAKKRDGEGPFGLTAIEAATIVPLSSIIPGKTTAETLSSLSAEALRKYHPEKILDLGGNRKGMRTADALMIAAAKKKK